MKVLFRFLKTNLNFFFTTDIQKACYIWQKGLNSLTLIFVVGAVAPSIVIITQILEYLLSVSVNNRWL